MNAFPYSELHQDECHGVSSSEEEEPQVEFIFSGGASSRESVRTAVSESGHR